MKQQDLLFFFAQLLQKNTIPYLLTGSFAVSYYGFPRATHDIDFVIEVYKRNSAKLVDKLKDLGSSFIVDELQIHSALQQSAHFNLLHLDTGIKIDFWIRQEDDFEKSKFTRKKVVKLWGKSLSLISAEDLILTKLLWCKDIYSDRHMNDCVGIWKIQGEKLDKNYVSTWAKRLKIEGLITQLVQRTKE